MELNNSEKNEPNEKCVLKSDPIFETGDDEFTLLNLLVKRDLKQHSSKEVFQVQIEKNETTCDLVYLGHYNNTPVQNILNFTLGDYQCDLISFAMDRDEIILQDEKNQSLLTISFLIGRENKIIGSLEFTFRPNNFVSLKKKKNDVRNIEGKFEIKLTTKKNGVYKREVIKEYLQYPGREESIYILTSVLVEENVIEKIEEEYR